MGPAFDRPRSAAFRKIGSGLVAIKPPDDGAPRMKATVQTTSCDKPAVSKQCAFAPEPKTCEQGTLSAFANAAHLKA